MRTLAEVAECEKALDDCQTAIDLFNEVRLAANFGNRRVWQAASLRKALVLNAACFQ